MEYGSKEIKVLKILRNKFKTGNLLSAVVNCFYNHIVIVILVSVIF